jgi:hypothetical protein
MTREEQIKAAAKKTTGLFSYRNGYSTAEDAFIAGAKWADANPCMPGIVVKIPERSREEIKELLANWKGTLVVGDDISPSPWISVEEKLPEEHTDVIVTDGSNVAHCKKYGDGFYTNIGKCCNVTHWMPIPQLPKEEKK